MAKPKITYTYTAPDGTVETFTSTREIHFAALLFKVPSYVLDEVTGKWRETTEEETEQKWSRCKTSKNYIADSALGQTGEQSRYFASFPHVNVPVTIVP